MLSLSGRISRAIYWPAYVALLSLNFALYFQLIHVVNRQQEGASVFLILIAGVALLYANIAVAVKRLHDVGYGGFLAAAVLIPLLNLAFSIWIGILPGTPGPNRFGDMPDAPAST